MLDQWKQYCRGLLGTPVTARVGIRHAQEEELVVSNPLRHTTNGLAGIFGLSCTPPNSSCQSKRSQYVNSFRAVILMLLCVVATTSFAQDSPSYKDGPVVSLSYIKIKPGKFEDYMAYLAGPYKKLMEEQKKAGLITGYGVYAATAKNRNEPDLILWTEMRNMAALDRTTESDAITAKIAGDIAAQSKGAIDRGAMREVLGSEIIRQLLLK
jgi:hypothetical protein